MHCGNGPILRPAPAGFLQHSGVSWWRSIGHPRSCCGIVVTGLEASGRAVVFTDCSVDGKRPAGCAHAVAQAYSRFQADWAVAEVNQGGEMAMLKSVDDGLPVTIAGATR